MGYGGALSMVRGRLPLFMVFLAGCYGRSVGAPADGGSGHEDAGDDAAMTADSDVSEQDRCFLAWSSPHVFVEASERPSAAEFPAMRLSIHYWLDDEGNARIALERITGGQVAFSSDDPVSIETNSGSWVELRDDSDKTLYTRYFYELVPESLETPEPSNHPFCPWDGVIRLSNFPNSPDAEDLVLFQEQVDGVVGQPTIEFARFRLPAYR